MVIFVLDISTKIKKRKRPYTLRRKQTRTIVVPDGVLQEILSHFHYTKLIPLFFVCKTWNKITKTSMGKKLEDGKIFLKYCLLKKWNGAESMVQQYPQIDPQFQHENSHIKNACALEIACMERKNNLIYHMAKCEKFDPSRCPGYVCSRFCGEFKCHDHGLNIVSSNWIFFLLIEYHNPEIFELVINNRQTRPDVLENCPLDMALTSFSVNRHYYFHEQLFRDLKKIISLLISDDRVRRKMTKLQFFALKKLFL